MRDASNKPNICFIFDQSILTVHCMEYLSLISPPVKTCVGVIPASSTAVGFKGAKNRNY